MSGMDIALVRTKESNIQPLPFSYVVRKQLP